MTKKLCNRCNTEKNRSEFRKDLSTTDQLQAYCKLCRREYDRGNYSAKYGDAGRARNAKRRAEAKAWIEQYRLAHPCETCGESCTVCLDFHHRDPSQKDFEISGAFNLNLQKIMNEIAKCAVLCRNCHAKVHAGVIVLQSISS